MYKQVMNIQDISLFTEITDEEAAAINGGSIFGGDTYSYWSPSFGDIANPDGTYDGTITPGDSDLGTFPIWSGGFL